MQATWSDIKRVRGIPAGTTRLRHKQRHKLQASLRRPIKCGSDREGAVLDSKRMYEVVFTAVVAIFMIVPAEGRHAYGPALC
jgi:hypothetical protein